jgi:hypothetical protein
MGRQVFLIEFKFPMGSTGEWIAFSAKARESSLTGIWEIYSIHSDSLDKSPFGKILLKKEINTWIDPDSNQETLLAALVGRAIDKSQNTAK